MRTSPFVCLLLLVVLTLAHAHNTLAASRHFRRLTHTTATTTATTTKSPAFTDVFRAYTARYNPEMTDAQVASLAITPPAQLAEAALTVDSLEAADELFLPWNQSSLWAAAAAQPTATTSFTPIADLDAVFRAQRVPPTILLIPGFMGELLHRPLFEEIVNTSSILSRRFASALQQCAGCADSMDDVFDMKTLQPRAYNLSDLVLVWSVDLPTEAVPAVQFILFKAPLMSMESFSLSYAAISDLLYRRMTKVMRLLEKSTQFELYPMGYSRSGGIVMEMIQDTKWQSLPIRGVVSLAGVHWGAHFADCGLGVLGHEASLCTLMHSALSVLDMLNSKLVPSLSKWADNAGLIMDALLKIVEGAIKTPSVPEMKQDSQIFPSIKSLWQNLIYDILKDLNLAKPISGYADRIRKAQVLMSHVLGAAGTLTTDQRVQWHQTHTIPSNLPYYVIINTQPDANQDVSDDNGKTHKLHPDSYSLRQEYYVVVQASNGQQFNDGQVAASRASLLPALHRKLNPQQADYAQQVQWLGILNSTHWSSAFPVGVETDDGWVAPFPRAAFIMSLAHVIASDANARAQL